MLMPPEAAINQDCSVQSSVLDEESIGTRSTIERIASIYTNKSIIPTLANEGVYSCASIQHIVAIASNDSVAGSASIQRASRSEPQHPIVIIIGSHIEAKVPVAISYHLVIVGDIDRCKWCRCCSAVPLSLALERNLL